MLTASRILGDQVGSTAPVFLAFLAVHVIAGLTAVITGAVAALTRKGSPRHIWVGRWFYRAITVVFGTATVLAAMRWRQDYYLFIIGFGARSPRRRSATSTVAGTGPATPATSPGSGIGYVAMLTAFYVDNGPHLPLWDRLPTVSFWLLPTVIGAPIIIRAVIRARHAMPKSSQPGPAVPEPRLPRRQRSPTGSPPTP